MDQQTINTYNELAIQYDQETIGFWQLPETTGFVGLFSEQITGKILNLGSGPGRDAELLRDK